MDGGTFTISNGGVFGSMFGTPIINPPQSAILGMHAIIERPVVINHKVSSFFNNTINLCDLIIRLINDWSLFSLKSQVMINISII